MFSRPNSLFIPVLLASTLSLFTFVSPQLSLSVSLDRVFIFDDFSLFLVYVTVFVIYISYLVAFSTSHSNLFYLSLYLLLLSCFMVFTTRRVFLFYTFYELSLVPIVYIIIKWGSYPERTISAIMFFVYTSFFTFPMLYFILYFISVSRTSLLSSSLFTSFNCYFIAPSIVCSLVVFLRFSVKLPIFGLHFWLPMAHVEAPTFGSIILAGILLKLGGIGLVRFCGFVNWHLIQELFLSYFFIFLLVSTVVCCYQSDFKRLVAYSSVSHIMPIPILVIASNILSFKCTLMLMFFHGFSSPILFMLVGLTYTMFSTRQIVLIRGILLVSPLLSFIFVLAFFYTMSAPPFPSFVAEVFILLSSLKLSSYFFLFFGLFLFLSLIYNLNWITRFTFSRSSSPSTSFSVSYSYILAFFVTFGLSFIFIPMLSFF